MKTDLFQSCGHCWVFQICWHIECSTFTASSFRIWNSSTGILSPPLALFIVMLSKAHLTSHSRMSGSSWVITPLWLSGSWRSFLYSSSLYSCHLFLITSASVIQYCVSLCQASTRISPRYTFIFSFLNLPPTSHPVLPFYVSSDTLTSLSLSSLTAVGGTLQLLISHLPTLYGSSLDSSLPS